MNSKPRQPDTGMSEDGVHVGVVDSSGEHDQTRWFWDHYDNAASQIIEFLIEDGLNIEGKQVADIGSGDGIIDLGVFHKAKPAKLVGYDVRPTDTKALRRTADAMTLSEPFPQPPALEFVASQENHIPADDNTFDFVFSWSVFEHVSAPVEMFGEVCRILKPDGVLFLQIWPLYFSEHGGHLWISYPTESFPHLVRSDDQIENDIVLKPATDPTRAAVDEHKSLNRLGIDDIQRAILAGGMAITKIFIDRETVHIPIQLAALPISQLGISGFRLLACPQSEQLYPRAVQ